MMSLGAAVAVSEAVEPLLPGQRVGLHWPNDVFAAGRKLAGVLVEGLPDGQQVVGIGLNVNNSVADAPRELRETATTLRDLTGVTHDRTSLLVAIMKRLERSLALAASDAQEVAKRANTLCLQHGQMLTVQSGRTIVSGRAAGIGCDGALLVDTPAGRRQFLSGMLR